MKQIYKIIPFLFFLGCTNTIQNIKVRDFADTIGFAHKNWQVDSILNRIERNQSNLIDSVFMMNKADSALNWIASICPHDDHSYVGYNYLAALKGIKAKTVILFGVAHKAKKFNIENQLVFGTFTHWKAPSGNIKVSNLRDSLIDKLNTEYFIIHDSIQQLEHSIEGIIPFLQYNIPDLEIIPILVPYMSYNTIEEISNNFSGVLSAILSDNNLELGKDVAIVISNDAVHYGDEDWGGKNFARFGADSSGYTQALSFEKEIIDSCLTSSLSKEKIKKFTSYTVKEDNYKDYKWTWCGRYSVPFGLSVLNNLNNETQLNITGYYLNYSTSIAHDTIPVADLGLGRTAPASIRHWVGYACIAYY